MTLEGILIGVGALLTGGAAMWKTIQNRGSRGDLKAVRREVQSSNGVPLAQTIEALANDLRQDRAALYGHLEDSRRHN